MASKKIISFRKYFCCTVLISLLFVFSISNGQEQASKQEIKPPIAEKIKKELTIHGKTRIDYYYWMNDRENPKALEYLKAENTYTEAVMKHTEEFQKKLYDEMVGRIKQTDMSVPYRDNGYYYYTRYEKGSEYPLYCRKKGSLDGQEEIMLNVNEMAKGFAFYHVAGIQVSSNNALIVYGVDAVSRRKYTIHIKNLLTGEILKDEIPNTSGRAAWANDNRTLFYTLKDESLRPYKIYKHLLGSDVAQDALIYHEKDETFEISVYKTKSKKYIIIEADHTLSSEFRYLDADNPDGKFKIILPRQKDWKYDVDHLGDRFYILTNYRAKNFRFMSAPVAHTEIKYWKEMIPHRNNVLLEGFNLFNNYLVLDERKDGLTQLRIINLKDHSEHYLDFGESTYSANIAINVELDSEWLRYAYSSLTTPDSIYDYNMKTHDKKLMKQEEVLGNFKPDNYQAERLYATAHDGKRIPISLVYKKGMTKNGENPLLLYGYGSYGYSMESDFNSAHLSLLDRGFIFAIAHIRGGQEMGRQWYEEGKLLKKKNTFTDFIACAEYLIAEKYTNPGKLFIEGGSAGGLLIGAVVNMRPDLFNAAIAEVPYVDAVTTMLDPSIPLTTNEYDEWGNPNIKKYYDYMLSYSPYDNVEAKHYPAMIVTTGLHDSQVQYWEPAKWVAKLRALKTDNNRLILFTNMEAGHGGASGRFEQYKKVALEYAFMLDLLGINK